MKKAKGRLKNPRIGGSLDESFKEQGVDEATRRTARCDRRFAELDRSLARGVADANAGSTEDLDDVRQGCGQITS